MDRPLHRDSRLHGDGGVAAVVQLGAHRLLSVPRHGHAVRRALHRRAAHARQRKAAGQHAQTHQDDQRRRGQPHRLCEPAVQPPAEHAHAQHQRCRAQAEAQHRRRAAQPASRGQRVELHGLKRPAGHQPIGQPDAEGRARREPAFGKKSRQRKPPQPFEAVQQLQRHDQHQRGGGDLYRTLRLGADGNALPQPAGQRADGRIGRDAAEVVAQTALPRLSAAPRRLGALSQIDAAAHGHAVQRGHQSHHEQRAEAHALPGHGKGGHPRRRGRARQQQIQPRRSRRGEQAFPPSSAPGAEPIAQRREARVQLRLGHGLLLPESRQRSLGIIYLDLRKAVHSPQRPLNGLGAVRTVHALHAPRLFHRAHAPFFQLAKNAALAASSEAGMVMLFSVTEYSPTGSGLQPPASAPTVE